MESNKGKMPLKNIMGYGVASIGFNFVYLLSAQFLNIYYTNVLGISLASVGVIMLIARLWDGVNDPIMGSIVDRTNTKQGKYRPYLIWGILPLASTTALLYYYPSALGENNKVIYAGVTYILFGMAYTFANIPYLAMQSTLSYDSDERTKIITIKNVFTLVGILFMTIIIPKIAFDSTGPTASGFLKGGLIGAVIVIITMPISYLSTSKFKFNDDIKEKKEKITFADMKEALLSNKPLMQIAGTLFIISIGGTLVGGGNYYFINVIDRSDLVGLFALSTMMPMMVGMALMPIAMKFEKKNVMGYGMIMYGVVSFIMFFVPQENPMLFIILNGVRGLGFGTAMILIWSMIADTVDYAKLKTGKQQGGIVFSTSTFMQKSAGGLGIALMNFLMIKVGLDATSNVQSASTAKGLIFIIAVLPGILYLINGIYLILKYPLNKSYMKEIQEKLGR